MTEPITYDSIVDLVRAMPEGVKARSVFTCGAKQIRELHALRNHSGNFILTNATFEGEKPTLLGWEVHVEGTDVELDFGPVD